MQNIFRASDLQEEEPAMSQPIIHWHRFIQRRLKTINTTWCGRVHRWSGDYNVSEHKSEVTCKLCLKIIATQNARAVQEVAA
jgi:hypothetical protein